VAAFDGRPLETRVVGATEIEAALPASATTEPGSFAVSVQSPKPGGGESTPVPFIVTIR
jgi:hypothetical protein